MNNNYVVIMAGGIGSRFWPMSTADHPKQFHDVLGTGRTLIQLTVDRYLPICNPENIIIVTNENYKSLVQEQLPDLKEEQYSRKGYSTDDKIFLWLLLLVAITGFLIEGVRISADGMPPFEIWSPVGWIIANTLNSLSTETSNAIHIV